MKRMFLVSFLGHVLLLSGLVCGERWLKPPRWYPRQIYQVSLISLPELPPGRILQTRQAPPTPAPTSPRQMAEKIPESIPKDSLAISGAQKPSPSEPKQTPSAPVELGGEKNEGIRVDAENFRFPYYLALLKTKIQGNWRPPPISTAIPFAVTVYFQVEGSGQITNTRIEKGSGRFLLDQSALRAVINSNPFPPLPREFARDTLGVHFEFEWVTNT